MNLFGKVEDVKNDFTTYPKSFENYRWYKPILVGILTAILFLILLGILFAAFLFIFPGMISNPYNAFNMMSNVGFDTPLGIFISAGIVLLIPALYLANRIVRDRPFSSLISSAGGWDWSLFAKSASIFIVIYVIVFLIEILVTGLKWDLKLTAVSFLLLVIITPLQCFAEEIIYRGFFMQTFGSWFRIPVVAIVLQAIIFVFSHGYNSIGLIEILVSGLCMGVIAWYSKGLEVSSALHSVNNVLVLLMAGLTTYALTDNVAVWRSVEGIVVTLLCFAAIFLIDKKTNWISLKKE